MIERARRWAFPLPVPVVATVIGIAVGVGVGAVFLTVTVVLDVSPPWWFRLGTLGLVSYLTWQVMGTARDMLQYRRDFRAMTWDIAGGTRDPIASLALLDLLAGLSRPEVRRIVEDMGRASAGNPGWHIWTDPEPHVLPGVRHLRALWMVAAQGPPER